SDLDSAARHAAFEMDVPSLQGEGVLLQSGFHAAFEPVHLSGSPPLVGEPLLLAAAGPTGRTTQPGSELIRRGFCRYSGPGWGDLDGPLARHTMIAVSTQP